MFKVSTAACACILVLGSSWANDQINPSSSALATDPQRESHQQIGELISSEDGNFYVMDWSQLVTAGSYPRIPVQGQCNWEEVGEEVISSLAAGRGISEQFDLCADALSATIAPHAIQLTRDHKLLIFATIASYSSRPYGHSNAHTMEEYLAAEAFDCDQYVTLAISIYEALGGDEVPYMIGWFDGPMGNHSQIYFPHQIPMVLDPTIGVVAFIDYHQILSGGDPDALRLDWRWRGDRTIDVLYETVRLSQLVEGSPWYSIGYISTRSDYLASSGRNIDVLTPGMAFVTGRRRQFWRGPSELPPIPPDQIEWPRTSGRLETIEDS